MPRPRVTRRPIQAVCRAVLVAVAALVPVVASAQRVQVFGRHVADLPSEGRIWYQPNRNIDEVYILAVAQKNTAKPTVSEPYGRVGAGIRNRKKTPGGPYALWDGTVGRNDVVVVAITLGEDDSPGVTDKKFIKAGGNVITVIGGAAGTAAFGPAGTAGGTAVGKALGDATGVLAGDDDVLGHYAVVLAADAQGNVVGHVEPGYACRMRRNATLFCNGEGGEYRPTVEVNGVALGPIRKAIPRR